MEVPMPRRAKQNGRVKNLNFLVLSLREQDIFLKAGQPVRQLQVLNILLVVPIPIQKMSLSHYMLCGKRSHILLNSMQMVVLMHRRTKRKHTGKHLY